MNFVVDESIDSLIAQCLKNEGHDVWYISELSPGIPDEEVISFAKEKQAILLTGDKDFGELVYRQKLITEGVVLVRLRGLPAKQKMEIVSIAVNEHKEKFPGAFSVITANAVRIRSLSDF